MAAERSKSVQADRTQINVNDAHDVRYWSEALGVTHDMLHDLVRHAGPEIDDVDDELRRRRATGGCELVVSITSVVKYRLPSRA